MLQIESLDHSFRGIAKINGKIVFVKNALPNEVVEIKIDKEKKKYVEASVLKYIKTSDERIKPKCKYFSSCGGCDIMHLSYKNQLKYKQEKIENIINKYFKNNIKINDIIYDNNLNYRNKVKFQVNKTIGLYKNETYEVIPIDQCLIANDIINKSIPFLNKLDLKNISSITCRTAMDKLMISIESRKDVKIDNLLDIADSIYINNKHIYGDKKLIEQLGEYKYVISEKSFFQVNKNICIKLYDEIKKHVGTNKNILDLYCGCGSIGIYVNKNNKVLGIEINESAINDAEENKKINNLKNIDFICADSSIKTEFKPDIVIVDPPRSGLNKKTIDNILKLKPNKIIYVSCNPMTLVRDLNKFDSYNILELTPFDMFPNTKHVEIVTILEKNTVN